MLFVVPYQNYPNIPLEDDMLFHIYPFSNTPYRLGSQHNG